MTVPRSSRNFQTADPDSSACSVLGDHPVLRFLVALFDHLIRIFQICLAEPTCMPSLRRFLSPLFQRRTKLLVLPVHLSNWVLGASHPLNPQ